MWTKVKKKKHECTCGLVCIWCIHPINHDTWLLHDRELATFNDKSMSIEIHDSSLRNAMSPQNEMFLQKMCSKHYGSTTITLVGPNKGHMVTTNIRILLLGSVRTHSKFYGHWFCKIASCCQHPDITDMVSWTKVMVKVRFDLMVLLKERQGEFCHWGLSVTDIFGSPRLTSPSSKHENVISI